MMSNPLGMNIIFPSRDLSAKEKQQKVKKQGFKVCTFWCNLYAFLALSKRGLLKKRYPSQT